MEDMKKLFAKVLEEAARHPRYVSLAAALLYLLVIFFYMTPQILNINSTLYGFGDNTAGAVWRYEVSPDSPFWGYERVTNFPFGENLSSPVHASGTLQYVPYWTMSKIFGPIIAYNLLNILGLLFSAMMMYGFISYLLKKRAVAFLAGYAVTFAPYYQMKIGGHPTYAYQGIIIGIIWLFFRLIEYKRKRDALFLGVSVAATAYFDIYFTLLAAVVMVSLSALWVGARLFAHLRRSEASKKVGSARVASVALEAKRLGLAVATAAVLVMPIFIFFAIHHQEITTDVAAARGNVIAEAKACSNWPHEYFTPFVLNPILEKLVGSDRYQAVVNTLRNNFSCGIGEDSIGLSITLGVILLVATIVITWEMLNKREIRWAAIVRRRHPRFIIIGLGVILLVAVAIAFPPLKFHNILPTPAYELLTITTTWRTLSRLYVLVNIAFVALAAVVLLYFWQSLHKRRWLIVAFVFILAGIVVEYQAFPPFSGNTLSNFNYVKDVPPVYNWLHDQKDISVVAEYPLEREGGESDAGSYYLTMQSIHKKSLFNSALSISPQDMLRSGLKNLEDPQTLPVLKTLGVNAIVAHGVTSGDLSGLSRADVLHQASQARFNLLSHTPTVKNDTTVVLGLRQVAPARTILMLDEGFVRNALIIKSVVDWRYETVNGSTIQVRALDSRGTSLLKDPVPVCFAVQMSVPTEITDLLVESDGRNKEYLGKVSGAVPQLFKVNARSTVKLLPMNGHNMRVSQLGCANE